MYIKLDEETLNLLCCPMCKSELVKCRDIFVCKSCGLRFPGRTIKIDEKNEELIYDFRILHPDYCVPEGLKSWGEAQSEYENYFEARVNRDSLQEYTEEIDRVREIYESEYHLDGRVLDVGGHQGRLRHFLGADVSLYVSIDPYIDIFSGINRKPNLLRAYPVLAKPCNFIAANAEYLPFKSGSFDWVHMRSVVDHFFDPYLAFLEAYRCSKPNGKLLVGLSIMEKMHELQKQKSFSPLRSIYMKFCEFRFFKQAGPSNDEHLFRFKHSTLADLFADTGWNVVKEHWQKPPYQYCIYMCGQKREPASDFC